MHVKPFVYGVETVKQLDVIRFDLALLQPSRKLLKQFGRELVIIHGSLQRRNQSMIFLGQIYFDAIYRPVEFLVLMIF